MTRFVTQAKDSVSSRLIVVSWLVLLLIVGSGSVGAYGPPDDAFDFQPGDLMTYSLRIEDQEGLREGHLSIWASETEDGDLQLLLKGELADEDFITSAQGPMDDPMTLVNNVTRAASQDLPYDPEQFVQFIFMVSWTFVPFDDTILQVGFEDTITNEFGEEIGVNVPERRTVSGFEGYVVNLIIAGEPGAMDVVFNPDLPLPLQAALTDEGFHSEFTLQEYAQDQTSPEIPASPRAHWEAVLNDLVQHLEAEGLEVSEVRPHEVRVMDATAALSVTFDGHDFPVELYAFDPETTAEETAERLREAAETGEMLVPMISMEIPVVAHGQLLLSNVEYVGGDHHPDKDRIMEAFLSF